MTWKTLDDLDLSGKRVLTRVDINVPVENGEVTDTTRIDRILPTVKDILAKGGLPVLVAHFGRPKGKVVPEMSLRQLLPALQKAFGQPVTFADGDYGAAVQAMQPGDILLLENIRFAPGKRRTTPISPPASPPLPISTATMPFPPPIAPMPRPRPWPGFCRPAPGD